MIVTESEGDRPITVKCILPEKMVLLRDEPAKRELSEEHKEIMANRLSEGRKAKYDKQKSI